ncbi:MAG: class I SAM-dependent methyltransferase [Deltaproteobacteria bacterium]|nr:class I SAM-dependent methyltransferase [Deltaproteobacteria bacterium]
MFARFLDAPPASILDVGCGTGRDLASLARDGADCTGVDILPAMIEFGRAARPQLRLEVGDMRSLRLGRTFDAILCMGSALMYAIADRDLRATLQTFAAHAHPGTLLVLDLNNASSWLGGGFAAESELRVDAPGFQATARVVNRLDRRRQTLTRSRTWSIPGQEPVEDRCEYRLLFPAELEHLLAEVRFRVAGMFDNKELADGDLAGPRLYVAAAFVAESGPKHGPGRPERSSPARSPPRPAADELP